MSARVWVRNREGVEREVAASAVPMLAPGGWRPLDEAELRKLADRQAADRAAREAALTPASARRAAPAEPATPPLAPEPPPAPAAEDDAEAPKRSGAKRRQDTTENEES